MSEQERSIWTEHLLEKHECGPYSLEETRTLSATVGERSVTLRVPWWLPKVEAITGAANGELLFVLARCVGEGRGPGPETGVVMVARRSEDGTYAVHVWHELYEWALGHLFPGQDSEE